MTLHDSHINLASPPSGLQYRPDLGLLLHERLQGRRLHSSSPCELWFSLSHDEGYSWSEPRFLLANVAQPGGVWQTTSVSYNDLLVDGEDLHLFVEFQVRHILHLSFTVHDLIHFPTQQELLSIR